MPLYVFPLKYKISDCSILSACYCTTWWWWSLGDSELTCGQYFPRPLSSPPDKDRVLVVADASVCWRLAGRLHCVEAGAWLRWDWLTGHVTGEGQSSLLTPQCLHSTRHPLPAGYSLKTDNWGRRISVQRWKYFRTKYRSGQRTGPGPVWRWDCNTNPPLALHQP